MVLEVKDKYFIKLQPVIFMIIGTIIGCAFYFMHQNVDNRHWVIWAVFLFLYMLMWLALGGFIKKLCMDVYSDELTGLWNRKYLQMKLRNEIKSLKGKGILSVAIVDADNFKCVNDTFGHMKGDAVLAELANVLKATVRKNDTVVRWGGEEFVIILPDTDKEGAEVVCERVRQAVERHNFSCPILLTISAGVASIKCCTDDAHTLLEMADKALYQAKRIKNSVISYEDGLIHSNC